MEVKQMFFFLSCIIVGNFFIHFISSRSQAAIAQTLVQLETLTVRNYVLIIHYYRFWGCSEDVSSNYYYNILNAYFIAQRVILETSRVELFAGFAQLKPTLFDFVRKFYCGFKSEVKWI
jgi:hypothetical protein